jgi:regulation of enolase protein 1 (concanavalin A-like superfamily)
MDVRERIRIMVIMMEEIFHTVKFASFKQQLTVNFGMLCCILKADERVLENVIL